MEVKKIDKTRNIITIGNKFISLDCNYWESDFDNAKEISKLFAYGVEDICISYEKKYCVSRIGICEYEITTCVVDVIDKIVKLFDLSIELDSYFPGDISVDDFVSFKVMRLDVI